MKKYGIIYLIRNKINNKIYIGQTVKTFKSRYGGNLLKFTHNVHLKNAIDKYGIENFEIDEEFDVAYSKEELDKLENLYIKLYKTTNEKFGYNKMLGGSNGLHTEETKRKMKKIQQNVNGVKVFCYTTKEVFGSIAEASRKYNTTSGEIVLCCQFKIKKAGKIGNKPLQWLYYNDYISGKTPEEIDRLICVTTNEVFDSFEEAVEKYPTATLSGISQCCSLIYNSCGFDNKGRRLQWLRYSDYKNGLKHKEIKDNRVICITTNKLFENAKKASEYYNIDNSHILENCKLKSNYCGELENGDRLQWLYYSDFLKGIKHKELKDDRVVCLNYNMVFKNSKEASVFFKLDKSCISKCCRGERRSCGKDEFGKPMRWVKYKEYIKTRTA